jgi:hypothetical protein
MEVRYGANTSYHSQILSNGTPCTNAVFGDPINGVVKHCDYRTLPSTPCSLYTPTSPIPQGFGSPYDVVSSPSTNLIKTTCDTTSVRVDLGRADPLQYIYIQATSSKPEVPTGLPYPIPAPSP